MVSGSVEDLILEIELPAEPREFADAWSWEIPACRARLVTLCSVSRWYGRIKPDLDLRVIGHRRLVDHGGRRCARYRSMPVGPADSLPVEQDVLPSFGAHGRRREIRSAWSLRPTRAASRPVGGLARAASSRRDSASAGFGACAV